MISLKEALVRKERGIGNIDQMREEEILNFLLDHYVIRDDMPITSVEKLKPQVHFKDNIIDVDTNLSLVKLPSNNSFTNGLFKFGNVKGTFGIHSKLKDLKSIPNNAPESVGDFFLSKTQISSLEGCPKIILGNLVCHQCDNLMDLTGIDYVGGNIILYSCSKLNNLKGLSADFKHDLYIPGSAITSLKDVPAGVKHIYINKGMKKQIVDIGIFSGKIRYA